MSQNIKKQIDYLLKLTDKIGIIEHCIFDKPDYSEGYCVDDNARALQVCLRFKKKYPILEKVIPIYFNFLKLAIKKEGLYSDLNSNLTWQKNFQVNGEHYGRALAALGEIIKFETDFSADASLLFNQLYLSLTRKTSHYTRVSSQVILGLRYYQSQNVKFWADSLVDQYLKEKTNSWKWFEEILSYDIGRIPLSLLTAYQSTDDVKYLNIAIESLEFLTKKIFDKKLDCFVFPGNKGWFTKSGLRVIFDQQPIEAGSMTEVYSLAFLITKNKKYKDLAWKSFSWYSGNNILKINMIDLKTGGVYDGFSDVKINKNQGAESILSYLLAYDAIEMIG